jgi:hypothetical protein
MKSLFKLVVFAIKDDSLIVLFYVKLLQLTCAPFCKDGEYGHEELAKRD